MSISGPPPPPHDPYENIKVNPVESDPHKHDPERQPKKKQNKSAAVFAHFLDKLEKIAAFFLQSEGKKGTKHTITAHSIEQDIKHILVALEKLKTEDYSQNVPYLNQLSSWWHQFLHDVGKVRSQLTLSDEIAQFIEQIHDYPEKEHSLGYYLLEYAGAEWIPFPFMDLLQDLHLEHKKTPMTSSLAKWTRILQSLLRKISRNAS